MSCRSRRAAARTGKTSSPAASAATAGRAGARRRSGHAPDAGAEAAGLGARDPHHRRPPPRARKLARLPLLERRARRHLARQASRKPSAHPPHVFFAHNRRSSRLGDRRRLDRHALLGFGRPQGIAFDATGTLFVIEALAGVSGLYQFPKVDRRSSCWPVRVWWGSLFNPLGGLVVSSNDTAYRLTRKGA